MNTVIKVVLIVSAAVFLFGFFLKYLSSRDWPDRMKIALFGFVLFSPFFYILIGSSGDGNMNGMAVLLPFAAAIVGYIIGSIAGFFNSK